MQHGPLRGHIGVGIAKNIKTNTFYYSLVLFEKQILAPGVADLIVTEFETTSVIRNNAQGAYEVRVRVVVENQGSGIADLFPIGTGYNNTSGSFPVAFTVPGQINTWKPLTGTSLYPNEVVAIEGKVTFPTSVQEQIVNLYAVADDCSGELFRPAYCYINESNEANNDSESISINIPLQLEVGPISGVSSKQ